MNIQLYSRLKMYSKKYSIMTIMVPIVFCGVFLITGCASVKRNPLPVDRFSEAEVLNTKGIRTFGGELDARFQEDLALSAKQELDRLRKEPGSRIDNSALLLSGGGAYGSFSAGFLNGWSSSGKRPEFKLVTGISTGALIAPLAFVGTEYDGVLKKMYTGISTQDVAKIRGISTLWNDSLLDPSPLMGILETFINEEFIDKVAQAHNDGRRLYIGTTNLDAQRLVIWNMGALANIDDPRTPELFRKIMLASSSIPIVFPPVMIEVKSDGVEYDEMHVDGGVITQVFFHLAIVDIEEIRREFVDGSIPMERGRVFIIRNGTILPIAEQIDRNLMNIAERSMSTMTKASAINDFRRIYMLSKRAGLEFNYVGIPEDFEFTATEAFDRLEMIDLYYLGYKIGSSSNKWKHNVPGVRQ